MLNGPQLREEAVTTQIEAIALELDRLCNPAHASVSFEDGARMLAAGENVCSREAGRPRPENRRPDALTLLSVGLGIPHSAAELVGDGWARPGHVLASCSAPQPSPGSLRLSNFTHS